MGITSSFTRLYDVDSVTASRRTVAEIRRPGFSFLLEAGVTPRFAHGCESDLSHTIFRFDERSSAWEPFAVKPGEVLIPMTISSDGKELLATVAEQGAPAKLIRQGIAGSERRVLAEDAVGDIGLIERGPFRSGPFAAGTSLGMPTLRYFDPASPMAQLHAALSAQFPGRFVHFRNFSRDGEKLLFSVASDRDPGAFYLFDRATGRASLLFASKPWIEPERMAEQRPIRFAARDGLELHGYLTLPPDRGDRKLPLVLLPHGGPHGVNDDWFFDTDAQFLASRGYAVLQVNIRGSSGRGEKFDALGHRQWGGQMVDDLIDGVRWTLAQGFVDAERICAHGASYGAYAAMMSAIRTPGMFKCAVGYAGLYDLAMIYDEYDAKSSATSYNYTVKVIGRDAAELAATSPTRQADKLTIPVLLVHGADDGVTPRAQVEAMRDALKKVGRPPEWFVVEDEGHGFYAPKNRRAFYEKLEAFLAKHIGE